MNLYVMLGGSLTVDMILISHRINYYCWKYCIANIELLNFLPLVHTHICFNTYTYRHKCRPTRSSTDSEP